MASKLWILFQRNKSFTDYLASFTQLFFASFLWFWSIWERCDRSQVLLIFISEYWKFKVIYLLFIIYVWILILCNYSSLSFLNSCLPTWTRHNPYELAFIWYVCIAGGVIPAILMITINLYVIFTLNHKVFYIQSNGDTNLV